MQSVTVAKPSTALPHRIPADPLWLGLSVLTMLSMSAALYAALVYAPTERVQGDIQRIFYFHVPLAWTAYLAFFVVFVASIGYLLKRTRSFDAVARSSAEVGLVLTTLMLIAGSLWARPVWGTWWTWDARLTTTLLLWFIYVGYLMLRSSIDDERRAARYAAIVGIVGAIDIPIIHQSVTWWRSLHPNSVVLAEGGPAMPTTMLVSLMVAMVAFTLVYVVLVILRTRLELVRTDIRALRRRALERAG